MRSTAVLRTTVWHLVWNFPCFLYIHMQQSHRKWKFKKSTREHRYLLLEQILFLLLVLLLVST